MGAKMAKEDPKNMRENPDPLSEAEGLKAAIRVTREAIKKIDRSKISGSEKAKLREGIRGLLDSWDEPDA